MKFVQSERDVLSSDLKEGLMYVEEDRVNGGVLESGQCYILL